MNRLLCFLCAAGLIAQPVKDRTVVVISIDGLPAAALRDPHLPAPTLRRMMREGAAAAAMRPVDPSVTWPNHTSMVTGVPPARHGVLFNGMLVRQGPHTPPKIEPWRDKSEMVRAPTVYDVAYQAGLTTAQVDWVAIYNAHTITWEFPERPNPKGPVEREMIAAGLLTEADLADFFKTRPVWRDEAWTNAAVHILREHKPSLLLYHLLNLDSIHHSYGPGTPAGYTAIAYADDCVRQVLAALPERSTVLVVSDHGFKTVRRNVHPNVLLREQDLLRDVYAVPEGGTSLVYVLDPARRAQLVPRLKQIFGGLEGVDRILDSANFPSRGLPLPDKYDQMADLILSARDGYSFGGASEGALVRDVPQGGSHGYLSSDPDMYAVFLAWGDGIRPGARLDTIDNADVAPTIAALLGLKMENITGRVLTGILK